NPDRSSPIGPDRQRPQTGGHGGGAAPARPPRRVREAPRVAARSEDRVVGDALEAELWGVRLAEHDGPGLPEPLDHRGILLGNEALVQLGPPRGAHPFGHDQVLDGYWYPVEVAERAAPHHRGFSLSG